MSDQSEINPGNQQKVDKGLKCLATIAAYYQIPCDPMSLIHQLAKQGSAFNDNDIIRAARILQLKSRLVKVKLSNLRKMATPAILKTEAGYILLLKADKERCMIAGLDDSNIPKTITSLELSKIWSGEIFLFIPRKSEKRDVEFGFKWFIPTVLKYKSALGEVLIAALFMQILALFSPLITQSVVDKVLVHNSLSTLDILAIALILIAVFETIMSVARNYIFAHTAGKIDVILSTRLFDHLFKLPMRYFETRRVGDTIARVRELENIRRFLTGVPMNTLLDALFIIVYIVVMLFYSTPLTLITVASIPILAIISAIVTPMLKSRLDEKFRHGAEQQSFLVEAVTGVQTIKSFAVEPQIHKKWESLLAKYTTTTFRMTILSGNAGAIAQFVQKVFDLVILWYGARLVIDGDLTVGALVAFRMLASRVSTPVLRLVQMWQDFQQTNISVKRLGDIFNTKTEPSMDSSRTRLPAILGHIRFDKVSFRYRTDTAEVIKNMSFEIKPDTVIGIVGKSGSGKSTISKLIQRMYIPESGKIRSGILRFG
jgi:subfamily B ATP-binding cassette protein HlyB/CyaB